MMSDVIKRQELFERAAAIAEIGVWELDLVSNELFWSAETRKLHGVAADFQPTLETAIAFYPPDAREIIGASVAQAMTDGRPWDLELPLIRLDGQEIFVRAVGAASLKNGKPIRLTGSIQNITSRVAERRAFEDASQRLRLATDAGGIGIWDWDVVHDRLIWDAKMYELYGTHPHGSKETFELWASHLYPDDRVAAEQALRNALAGAGPFETEFRVVWDDGSIRYIRGAGVVTRDVVGRALRVVGTNWDITAQKLAEANRIQRELEKAAVEVELERIVHQAREGAERISWVQREKDRFRGAIDAVQGVLWTNNASGRMSGEQPGWAALTGQKIEEYQDYGWANAVHPDDAQPTMDAWNEAVAERRVFQFEHRVRRHDGDWRTFSIRAVPLLDQADILAEWVGVHTDITEQRKAEITLQATVVQLDRTANEFLTLAEGMADLCWMAHPDGHIYWYNRRWYDYTGKSPAEMEGWGWQSVHDSDLLPGIMESWRASIATGNPFEMTFPLRGSDGVFRPFLTRVKPVHGSDGQIQRWLGTNVDVSDLEAKNAALEERVQERTVELERLARHLARARDVAEKANLAKTRFLAGMSHELRTPLNGILGYAQMLRREGGLNDLQNARLEAMLGAGSHLLEMITSILDVSAIETEHLVLNVSDIDVSEIMLNCLDVIGAAAETKGLSLSLATTRGTPRRLTTDPIRLRQVVLNLLGNAVKFTAHGSIELRLCLPIIGTGLRIEIMDTGPGIPATLRPRLFQDFARLNTRAAASVEGSGLGLALSARLVTLLGGRIGHDDKPSGGGSVFWVELPLAITGTQSPWTTTAPAKAALETPVRTLRVLVVDDVAMNREVALSFLSSANHSPTCAESGAEAVAAATSTDYDVILMDVNMPEVDGLEATRRIRRLPGRRGRVPIIGLTAHAFAEQVADCKKAGMDMHMSKPFSPDTLLESVARAVAAGDVHADDALPVDASIMPVAAAPITGTEWPVIDEEQMKTIANFLSADKRIAGLENIAKKGQFLLRNLDEQQTGIDYSKIAGEVHELAGNAGLFGFPRLANVGQRFEYAVCNDPEKVSALIHSLRAVVEATLKEIQVHLQPNAVQ